MAHPQETGCMPKCSQLNWEMNHKHMASTHKSVGHHMDIWEKNNCKLLGLGYCYGNSGEGETNTDCDGWCRIQVIL